jgi:hypothetical protein
MPRLPELPESREERRRREGAALRARRTAAGLSLRGLSALIDPPVAREALCGIEAGRRGIGPVLRHRIEAAFARVEAGEARSR